MTGYYINFIRTGDPNGGGLPEWGRNLSSDDLMELGETTGMIKEDKLPLYEILDRMTGWE